MRLHPSLHRALLGTFLLASGCAQHYDNFQDEYFALQCDLSAACNPSYTCHSTGDHFYEKDECTRYKPTKANRCIRQMEEFLEQVEAAGEDSQLCTDRPWTEIEECNDATEGKNGPRCSNEIVTGRPLWHEGQMVLASVERGHAWAEPDVVLPAAEPERARAAAEYWLLIARAEHASVAAFARVSMELMAVGAPPHLLAGCHQAALDEIQHAQLALQLARAWGEGDWDLGAMPEVPTRTASLRQIAIDALVEGCIGEGGAAASAQLAADRAVGPVADHLRQIAADETRHAALAWSTLRWALEQDPSLGAVLRHTLDQAALERRQRLPTSLCEPSTLAALGVATAAEATQVELDVLEQIVRPLLERMLVVRPMARA